MKWRTEARGAAQWYNVLGTLGALESIPSTKRKEIRRWEGKEKWNQKRGRKDEEKENRIYVLFIQNRKFKNQVLNYERESQFA